jgi:hypothetical protein
MNISHTFTRPSTHHIVFACGLGLIFGAALWLGSAFAATNETPLTTTARGPQHGSPAIPTLGMRTHPSADGGRPPSGDPPSEESLPALRT